MWRLRFDEVRSNFCLRVETPQYDVSSFCLEKTVINYTFAFEKNKSFSYEKEETSRWRDRCG